MADNSKRIGYVPGICEDCGKVFYHKGFGYFCPECRKERVERLGFARWLLRVWNKTVEGGHGEEGK